MKCSVCGAQQKLLLTSWYCPREEQHATDFNTDGLDTKPKFRITNNYLTRTGQRWVATLYGIPPTKQIIIVADMTTAYQDWGTPLGPGPGGVCDCSRRYRVDAQNIACFDCGKLNSP